MAITYWNDTVREDMKRICSDEVGINSFKMFMAYKDVFMLRDNDMIEVFKTCRLVSFRNLKKLSKIAKIHLFLDQIFKGPIFRDFFLY